MSHIAWGGQTFEKESYQVKYCDSEILQRETYKWLTQATTIHEDHLLHIGVGSSALPPMRSGLGSRRGGKCAQGGGQGGTQSARGRPLHLQVAKKSYFLPLLKLYSLPLLL